MAGETQRLLAGSGDGSVVVWRLDGKPLFGRSVRRSAHLVFRLDPAPDGSRLALAGMSESKGFVQLYEPTALAELGQPTTTGPGPASGVHFIDAGDPLVATLSGIERLQWFSQAQPAAKPVLETGAGVPGTGIDSTRRWLGVVQRDGVVRLVDTKDMSERWRTALSSGGRAQRFPAVARDGRRVAVGTDSFHVVLLDGATGRPFGEPAEGHRLEVTALAFDPVRPVLYSSSLDGSVRQWTASTGTSLGSIGDAGGAVQTIAVAPDGGVLAAATHDATVVLWELPSRRELAKLRGDLEGPVTALAFSPTGDELFAADMAGHLVAWPAREDGWRQLACAIAGRNLTEAEAEAFLGRSKAPELCSLATNQE